MYWACWAYWPGAVYTTSFVTNVKLFTGLGTRKKALDVKKKSCNPSPFPDLKWPRIKTKIKIKAREKEGEERVRV